MSSSHFEALWGQFGASIKMLENAIKLCPDSFWDTEKNFWYWAFHCIFWLDYYLTLKPDEFTPPEPFPMTEFDPEGVMPDRTFSREELLSYLQHCRRKGHDLILRLTDESAGARWINENKNYSVFEIVLYNMRHVQHHAAQLNLLLRQNIDDSPRWVSVSKD